jgi:LytS/YehU family sensor histidine kinase
MLQLMQKYRHQRRLQAEAEEEKLKGELRFLKSQINPHFLFNTLNSAYALTLQKSDLAPNLILKLSQMLRYVLYECQAEKVPLEREIKYLRDYIDLESFRLGGRLDVDLKVEGALHNVRIPPMILQPFVENAIKHGVANSLQGGWIKILIRTEPSQVANIYHFSFQVRNSIPHQTTFPLNPTLTGEGPASGIGIDNVRRRLNLLFPNTHRLEIIKTNDQYKISLSFDLQLA